MQVTRTFAALVAVSGIGLGSALSAQAPVSQIDTHINAARAAAGQDYRATFVNLCFPGAQSRLSRTRAARAGSGGAGRWARGAEGEGPGATPDRATLVRIAIQGLRQPVLARHAPAFVLGAAHERGPHHHRHELRLGHRAGDHRRPDDARSGPAADQIRRSSAMRTAITTRVRRNCRNDSAPRS